MGFKASPVQRHYRGLVEDLRDDIYGAVGNNMYDLVIKNMAGYIRFEPGMVFEDDLNDSIYRSCLDGQV